MGIKGETLILYDPADWQNLGLSALESCRVKYMAPLLALPDGAALLESLDNESCVVCNASTVGTTLNLLRERGINIPQEMVETEGWITPLLIYKTIQKKECANMSDAEFIHTVEAMKKLRLAHEAHLITIRAQN